jgi:acyl transferase domain-containing protein/acyl carrier protein
MSGDRSLSPVKQALLVIERLQAKIASLEGYAAEPIAIVGAGMRFPGGVAGRDAYWRLLKNGVDAITVVPPDRWDADAFYDPDPDAPGRINTRFGGFLDRIDTFDADFFGISPHEARSLDPQQRLLLEVAWEAFEDAAYAADRLEGSRTGVFVGLTIDDYLQLQAALADLAAADAYAHHGSVLNAAAGRIAYTLGLQGPCMAVDTACSASLAAVHLACQSLRADECTMALAGGVNVLASPLSSIRLAKGHMLAPDGRCKTFDAAANGYVRAEGCGLVVLRRLSDAVRDGDPIVAVIRGSAINQDGRSSGLTVPNGLAQTALIRQALDRARVRPDQIDYVEAHGTGTALGDPIEIEAIAAALGPRDRAPALIGSVKTNLGHLESASGVAGLLKVALALERGVIPASLHFHAPTPHVAWDALSVKVAAEPTPWPRSSRTRIAGVSAFGASGTNVHVVVEEAPERPAGAAVADRSHHLLVLSARSNASLAQLAMKYREHLADASDELGDICHTAAVGRAHFAVRLAAVADTRAQMAERLGEFERGELTSVGTVPETSKPSVAFLFTGQGAQYAGMARALFDSQPTFRAALTDCSDRLAAHLDRPLLSVIYPEAGAPSPIDETRYTQPALFAVEYALTVLLRSWGIVPDVVLGHSIGELVAACVAGAIGLDDALALVAARGRLIQSLPAGGGMAAVQASVDQVAPILSARRGQVGIAALNARDQVVLTGGIDAVDRSVDALERAGFTCQRLSVSHAFHSALMDPILDEFERVASTFRYAEPRIPLVSNLSGAALDGAPDAGYWRRHLRETVNFASAIRAVYELGCRVIVEIGPAATLTPMAQRTIDDPEVAWLPTLRRSRPDSQQLLETVGTLYTRNVPIDWPAFDRDFGRRRVSAPTYAFERRRFWLDGLDPNRLLDRTGASDVAPEAGRTTWRDWFYKVAWRPVPRPDRPRDAAARGAWIVIGDRDGFGAVLSHEIESCGGSVRLLPGVAEPALADALAQGGSAAVRAVVYARTERELGALDGVGLERRAVDACAEVAMLVRALEAAPSAGSARLWVVTRNAQSTGGEPAVASAALWGFGRAAALEYPDAWGGVVDIDDSDDAFAARTFVGDVVDPDGENQIALRGRTRTAARLVPARPVRPTTIAFGGPQLVTGGLGALGLYTAERLVDRGARHLVLTGRRPPTAAALARIERLRGRDAQVDVLTADIGHEADVARVLDQIARGPALERVFHAAGTIADAVLRHQDRDRIARVFGAKAIGAWHLHRLTRALPLRAFVMYSSSASVIGSAGQANYAAANAVLDAIARLRHASGLPATSINWGPWAESGLAAAIADRDERRWVEQGIQLIAPGEGLDALEACLAGDMAQAIVWPADWSRFLREVSNDPLYRELGGRSTTAVTESFGDRLRAAAPRERSRLLIDHVRTTVGTVLAIDSGQILDITRGFRELGFDSLMALQLRNRLRRSLGCDLSSTIAFDHPTIETLSGYVLERMFGRAEPAAIDDDGQLRARLISSIREFTDEQAEAALLAEIERP